MFVSPSVVGLDNLAKGALAEEANDLICSWSVSMQRYSKGRKGKREKDSHFSVSPASGTTI
jgi:hypothetical protein